MLNLINPAAKECNFLSDFDINLQFAKLKEIYGIKDIDPGEGNIYQKQLKNTDIYLMRTIKHLKS